MKEIISFYIGQAGVQIGSALWELLCAEHNISASGDIINDQLEYEWLSTLFEPVSLKKWVPRSLFVDLEPTVVDEIRIGSFRALFHPDRLVNGPEDAANNFARGYFTVGKLILGKTNEQCRRLFEQSDGVQGMIFLRSLGGGTGAGLTSAVFEGISDYSKTTKIEIPIYPSPTLSNSMVEPYNCLLGEHFCMEDIDVGILLDNEAMYEICSIYLSLYNPTFNTINRMIAQVISSITASSRFLNILNCDLTVLQTNLIPYPRIHFPLCNFAPVLNDERASHQDLTVQELTRFVFDRKNQMVKVDHFYGKFMACALLYRGKICPHHIYLALSEIKRDKNIEFVDWCPTGFKVGINAVPPVTIPESKFAHSKLNVAMLTNTSAISQAWQRLTHRFYLLYSKRSFVHWFVGEGMEESEFSESLYNISTLVKDYEEAGENTVDIQNDSISDQQNEKIQVIEKLTDLESSSGTLKNDLDRLNTLSNKRTNSDSAGIVFKTITSSTHEDLSQSRSNGRISNESNNILDNNQSSSSVLNSILPQQGILHSNNQESFINDQNPIYFNDTNKTPDNISLKRQDLGFPESKFVPNYDRKIATPSSKRKRYQVIRFKNMTAHSEARQKTSNDAKFSNLNYLSKGDEIKLLKLKHQSLLNLKRKMPMFYTQSCSKTFNLSFNPMHSSHNDSDYITMLPSDVTLNDTKEFEINDLCADRVSDYIKNKYSNTLWSGTSDKNTNRILSPISNERFLGENINSIQCIASTDREIALKSLDNISPMEGLMEKKNITELPNTNITILPTKSDENLHIPRYKEFSSALYTDRELKKDQVKSLYHNTTCKSSKPSLVESPPLALNPKVPISNSTFNDRSIYKGSQSNIFDFDSSVIPSMPLKNAEKDLQFNYSSSKNSTNPQHLSSNISIVKSAEIQSKPIPRDLFPNTEFPNFLGNGSNKFNLPPKIRSDRKSIFDSKNHNLSSNQAKLQEMRTSSMDLYQYEKQILSKYLENNEKLDFKTAKIEDHKSKSMCLNLFNHDEALENLLQPELKYSWESNSCNSSRIDSNKIVLSNVDSISKSKTKPNPSQGFSVVKDIPQRTSNHHHSLRRTIFSKDLKAITDQNSCRNSFYSSRNHDILVHNGNCSSFNSKSIQNNNTSHKTREDNKLSSSYNMLSWNQEILDTFLNDPQKTLARPKLWD